MPACSYDACLHESLYATRLWSIIYGKEYTVHMYIVCPRPNRESIMIATGVKSLYYVTGLLWNNCVMPIATQIHKD
jgi:hypothetical protein